MCIVPATPEAKKEADMVCIHENNYSCMKLVETSEELFLLI